MDSRQITFAADFGAASAGVQKDDDSASRHFALGLAFYFAIALVTLGWLIVPSSMSDVSAAARDGANQPGSQVPYFPSLYINQATEIEQPVATF